MSEELEFNNDLYEGVFDANMSAADRLAALKVEAKENVDERKEHQWSALRKAGKKAAAIDYTLWARGPGDPSKEEMLRNAQNLLLNENEVDDEEVARLEVARMKAAAERAKRDELIEEAKKKYVPKYGEIGHFATGGFISDSVPKSDVDWAVIRAKEMPGPGAYTLPDLADEMLGGKFSTAVPKSELDYRISEARQMPGPGTSTDSNFVFYFFSLHIVHFLTKRMKGEYKLPVALNQTGGVFTKGVSKSELDWAIYRAQQKPGPGEYKTFSTLKKSGGRWGKQITESEIDKTIRRARSIPGPGHYYKDRTSLNLKGGKWSVSSPKSYLDWIILNAKETPGPGTYTINKPAKVLAGSHTVKVYRDPSVPWYDRMYEEAQHARQQRPVTARAILFGRNVEDDHLRAAERELADSLKVHETKIENDTMMVVTDTKKEREAASARIHFRRSKHLEQTAAILEKERLEKVKEFKEWTVRQHLHIKLQKETAQQSRNTFKEFEGLRRLREDEMLERHSVEKNALQKKLEKHRSDLEKVIAKHAKLQQDRAHLENENESMKYDDTKEKHEAHSTALVSLQSDLFKKCSSIETELKATMDNHNNEAKSVKEKHEKELSVLQKVADDHEAEVDALEKRQERETMEKLEEIRLVKMLKDKKLIEMQHEIVLERLQQKDSDREMKNKEQQKSSRPISVRAKDPLGHVVAVRKAKRNQKVEKKKKKEAMKAAEAARNREEKQLRPRKVKRLKDHEWEHTARTREHRKFRSLNGSTLLKPHSHHQQQQRKEKSNNGNKLLEEAEKWKKGFHVKSLKRPYTTRSRPKPRVVSEINQIMKERETMTKRRANARKLEFTKKAKKRVKDIFGKKSPSNRYVSNYPKKRKKKKKDSKVNTVFALRGVHVLNVEDVEETSSGYVKRNGVIPGVGRVTTANHLDHGFYKLDFS
eukprot:g3012.t1